MQLGLRRKGPERHKVDVLWTALTCGLLAVIVLLGVTADRLRFAAEKRASAAEAAKIAAASSDDDIRTGSILMVPPHGDVCDKHMFDNDTGRIWFSGQVSCEQALTVSRSKRWSPTQRVEAIRSGFR